jgi:hypothetical protein
VPEFVKFNLGWGGGDNRTTREDVNQSLTRLGEASLVHYLKISPSPPVFI